MTMLLLAINSLEYLLVDREYITNVRLRHLKEEIELQIPNGSHIHNKKNENTIFNDVSNRQS